MCNSSDFRSRTILTFKHNISSLLCIKGACTPCKTHFKVFVSLVLCFTLNMLYFDPSALITFIYYRCCCFKTRVMVFIMNTLSHQTLYQRIRAPKHLNPFSCGHTQAGKIAMPRVEEVKYFSVFTFPKQLLF